MARAMGRKDKSKEILSKKILTVPNIITFLRVFLAPLFILAILNENLLLALILFFIAAASDSLDGYIARHFKAQSHLGKIIDPAADKLLMTTAYIFLAFDHPALIRSIPLWLTILVVGRDIIIVTGCTVVRILNRHLFINPIKIGKLTTFFEVLTIFLTILFNLTGNFNILFEISIAFTSLFCVTSIYCYVRAGMVQLEEEA